MANAVIAFGLFALWLMGPVHADIPQPITIDIQPSKFGEWRTESFKPTTLSIIDLEDAKVRDISKAVRQVPNVNISNGTQRQFGHTVVRGITDALFTNVSPLVFYYDDLPVQRREAVDAALLDVTQISIHKMPQGSRYARSGLGGVVDVQTRDPSYLFEGSGAVTAHSYRGRAVRGWVSGPVHEDMAHLGISIFRERRDGFTKNTFFDKTLDDRDTTAGRLRLRLYPSDDTIVTASVFGEVDRDGARRLDSLAKFEQDPFKVSRNYQGSNERDIFRSSLKVETETDAGKLTSVSGYQYFQSDLDADADVSTASTSVSYFFQEGFQVTQEVRLGAPNAAGRDDWVLGLFLSYENIDEAGSAIVPPPNASLSQHRSARHEDLELALFGEFRQPLADKLDLVIGGRAMWFRQVNRVIRRGALMIDQGAPNTEVAFLPRLDLLYQWSDTQDSHMSLARGFRAGGANMNFQSANQISFDPTYTWNFEVGHSIRLPSLQAVLTGKAFYIRARDFQAPNLSSDLFSFYATNAQSAEIAGAEISAKAVLAEGLVVQAGFGFQQGRYLVFNDPVSGQDLSGNAIELAPQYTLNAAVDYRKRLSNGMTGAVRAAATGMGRRYLNATHEVRRPFYTVVDLSASLEKGNLKGEIFVNNVFNRSYVSFAGGANGSSTVQVVPGAPRMMGVRVSANF